MLARKQMRMEEAGEFAAGNMLDFYLSEMSASDLHGGGLTLQRILSRDLEGIGRFVHIGGFARDVPPTAALLPRSEFVVSMFEEKLSRRLIGCRLSYWFFRRPAVWSRYLNRAVDRLKNLSPGKETLYGLVCPQSDCAVNALEVLKRLRRVKYISWMMDDYMVHYIGGRWVYPSSFRSVFEKHLREADSVFVISPAMAELYKREFGVSSTVLFGPADDASELREVASSDGILRIGYFGRIWRWQLEGLSRFVAALDPGLHRLDIYTPEAGLPAVLRAPGVTASGFLPKHEVPDRMRNYDAVLLPLSFDDVDRNMVDLNIATKMSECLASGTVTIVFGPQRAAMVRFLQHTGAACVITNPSPESWLSHAQKLRDVNYRRQVLAAAQKLLKTDLSTDVMRGRWRTALGKLIAGRESVFAAS